MLPAELVNIPRVELILLVSGIQRDLAVDLAEQGRRSDRWSDRR